MENPELNPETPATSQDEHVEETPQQTQEQEQSEETEAQHVEDGKDGETPQDEPQDVQLNDNLTKLSDGSYRFVVDPEDPRSTVYTGKDEKELWANIAKGNKEKDSIIRQTKSKSAVPKIPVKPQVKEEAPAVPDEDDIAVRLARKRGVDQAMLNFNRDDWRNYELEHGTLDAVEMRDEVKKIKAQAAQESNSALVQNLNYNTITHELKEIEELCEDFKVSMDEIDLTAILEKMEANPTKYYQANGLIAPGALTKEAVKAIRAVSVAQTTKTTRESLTKKIQAEQLAKRGEKKAAATTASSTKGQVKDVPGEVFDSLDKLSESLKKQVRRGDFN